MESTQKKRRGRPLKDDNATEVLPPIRVTLEQKQLYKKAAKKADLGLSAWIRFLADKNS